MWEDYEKVPLGKVVNMIMGDMLIIPRPFDDSFVVDAEGTVIAVRRMDGYLCQMSGAAISIMAHKGEVLARKFAGVV